MMPQHLVSIIVPCYNQGAFLADALDSVLHQTYANWECIIVNDGSTDSTNEVAGNYTKKDPRFIYLNIENGGVSNARNVGIAASKGFYILPLDGDDKISKNYIELLVEATESDMNLKVVYGKTKKFGIVNEDWKLSDYSFRWLLFTNMIHCTALFRRSDFDKLPNGYDVKMHEGLEDWEFWINLLKDGGGVKRVDSALFYYRVKAESRMTNISLQKRYRLLAYIYDKYSPLYEQYISQNGVKMKIDFPYSFYLSAKTYTPNDAARIEKFRNYYNQRLKLELSSYDYFTKKKLLLYWYRRGKLNLSFWDVVLK